MQSIYIEENEMRDEEWFARVCEKVRDYTASAPAVMIHDHCNQAEVELRRSADGFSMQQYIWNS